MTSSPLGPTTCTLCPELCTSRKNIVNGRGYLSPRILFVGEGPGFEDDNAARILTGRTGHVVAQLCNAAGIDPGESYFTNSIRCRPKNGRPPRQKEIENCYPFLRTEIRRVDPQVIVTMGQPAIAAMYGRGTKIADVLGQVLYSDDFPGIPIVATYSPTILKNKTWGKAEGIIRHLRRAARIADEGPPTKMGDYHTIRDMEEMKALSAYLLGGTVNRIAIDTETTGLDWMTDEMLCISFSPEEGIGYTVPLLSSSEVTSYTERELTPTRVKTLLAGSAKRFKPGEQEWAEEHKGEDPKIVDRVLKVPEVSYKLSPYWETDEEWDVLIEEVGRILASDVPKSGQNLGYDIPFLERRSDDGALFNVGTAFGWTVNNYVFDSMAASRLLHESLPANLTALTANWTNLPYYEKGVSQYKTRMKECPDEILHPYAAADVDVVQRCEPEMVSLLEKQGTIWLMDNITIPLVRCGVQLTMRGAYIDPSHFDKLCDYYASAIQIEKEVLYLKLGELLGPFTDKDGVELERDEEGIALYIEKPTYWQNLQELLFNQLGLPLTAGKIDSAMTCEDCRSAGRNTPCKDKHAGTSNDLLMELFKTTENEVLPILVSVKKLEKTHGTYLDGGDGGFRRYIRPDKRIHARWSAGAAETGRFTCSEPNMMNPPKNVKIHDETFGIDSDNAIREMFAGRPGTVIMNADWSQLELWVLAYETGDKTLLNLLLQGEDVHSFVAREMCKMNLSGLFQSKTADDESVSNAEWRVKHEGLRDKAKVFTFGISYGLTEEGAADRLHCSKEQGRALIEAFLVIFPSLREFMRYIQTQVLELLGVPNKFGRWRHMPEVKILQALNYTTDLEALFREAVNFPIQSGGHDLHSLAHIATERNEELIKRAWPVSEMHDSLAFEALGELGDPELSQTAWMIKSSWETLAQELVLPSGDKLGWQIPVEVEWGPNFGRFLYKINARGQEMKKNSEGNWEPTS